MRKAVWGENLKHDFVRGLGWNALAYSTIHPLSIIGKIPAAKITKLIKEVCNYARIFYDQLQNDGINNFFQVYQQKQAADGSEVTMKVLSKSKRKIYFSEHRQVLYG